MNEPGWALAAATRSPTVFKPRDGETTSTFGETPIGMTAEKSRAGSNVRFGCNSGLIVCAEEFTRMVYPSGSDLATKAVPIVVPAPFNDHRLTELARELIADHTRHNVDDASGGKGDNRSDRSGRPSLCPCLSVREGEGKNRQQYEANPRHPVLPRIEAGIAWKICHRAATRGLPSEG